MDVSQQNQKLCSVSIIHFSVEPNNRIDGASTSQRLKKLKHLRNRHVNYGNAFSEREQMRTRSVYYSFISFVRKEGGVGALTPR